MAARPSDPEIPRGAGGPLPALPVGPAGIFRTLAREHEETLSLMQLVDTAPDAVARRELFPRIERELLAHALAEEQVLGSVLRAHAATRRLAEHEPEAHAEVRRRLVELHGLDPEGPEWPRRFHRLLETVRAHVEEEEGRLFPAAREVVSAEQAEELDGRFDATKRTLFAEIEG